MKQWLRFRHRLFPYIYTMNYRNHTALEPFLQPMYYAHPKNAAAYEVKNQFMFGSELMVAPITQPNNPITCKGSTKVWLPKGDWFDFFSGLHYTSKKGRTLSVHRDIGEYPVFAKAGAIVPLQKHHLLEAGDDLEIVIFPGADNSFTLYEDAGDGSEFEKGEFVQTEMVMQWSEAPVFTVEPAKGAFSLLPKRRSYHFVLRGFAEGVAVKALVNGKEVAAEAVYDRKNYSVELMLLADPASEIKLLLSGETLITDNGDLIRRCSDMLQRMQLELDTKVQVIKILSNPETPYATKLRKLNFKCAKSAQHQAVMEALLEQLTLTE